jgi:hypothetical protein
MQAHTLPPPIEDVYPLRGDAVVKKGVFIRMSVQGFLLRMSVQGEALFCAASKTSFFFSCLIKPSSFVLAIGAYPFGMSVLCSQQKKNTA